jgi:hypothetical protein
MKDPNAKLEWNQSKKRSFHEGLRFCELFISYVQWKIGS